MKKTLSLIIGAVLSISLLSAFIVIKIISGNKLKIAFYQIPQNVEAELKDAVKQIDGSKIKFYTLDGSKPLSKDIRKKYSILFAYNSKTVQNLYSNIETESLQKALSYLPTKIRWSVTYPETSSPYALPVLLDHFELALYRTYRTQLNLSEPQTLDQLTSYLEKVKEKASFPLLVMGADDEELFGFISVLAQSEYSAEDYRVIADELFNAQKINSELPYKLRIILDQIKSLQAQKLIHPLWTQLTKKDTEFLMSEHQAGCFSTYMNTHRTMPYILTKYYDSVIFPQKDVLQQFGVIIPEICAVPLKEDARSEKIFLELVSDSMQTKLSEKTQLAPAASIGESHDSIADDVRFYAASSPNGPLESLSKMSFTNPSQTHKYAQIIRDYLKD